MTSYVTCVAPSPHKVHWNRAARTDKGVSAAGNVVSVNVIVQEGVDYLDRYVLRAVSYGTWGVLCCGQRSVHQRDCAGGWRGT